MEEVKKTLNEFNLKLDLSMTPEKYFCKLCQGILIEPIVSKCLCRFCKSCIVSYLINEPKSCPNCLKYKKDVELNYQHDISPDFVLSKKLHDILLKCPNEGCLEKIALKDFSLHIRNCIFLNCKEVKLQGKENKKQEILTNVIREETPRLNLSKQMFTFVLIVFLAFVIYSVFNLQIIDQPIKQRGNEFHTDNNKKWETTQSNENFNEKNVKYTEKIKFTGISNLKRNSFHYSNSIILSDYKFRCRLYLRNNNEIGLSLWLQYPALTISKWPLKNKVQFSIIHPDFDEIIYTEFQYKTSDHKETFHEPIDEDRLLLESLIWTLTNKIVIRDKVHIKVTLIPY